MRLRYGLLAVLAAAAFPASAAAAPDKTSELSADLTKFEWTGEGTGIPLTAAGGQLPVNPFGCDTPGHDCEYILLDVKHPGAVKLTAAADNTSTEAVPLWGDVSVPDIDVYFYKSNKDGTPEGDSLSGNDCATGAAVETCEVKDLQAGFHVVEVSFFLADAATYKASAELSTPVPPTPPAAPPAPEAPPAPPASEQPPAQSPSQPPPPPAQPYNADEPKPKPAAQKKKPSKKAACKKKAKKVKSKAKRKKALKRCAKIRR